MKRTFLIGLGAASAMFQAAGAAPPGYPQTVNLNNEPTPAEAAVVRGVLGRSLGKEWSDYEKKGRRIAFMVGHADLNGDGRPDLLVLLNDPGFGYCGSAGCSGYAILATPQGYAAKPIDLANFYEKMTVLAKVHRGMHDLRYDDGRHVFIWSGTEYR